MQAEPGMEVVRELHVDMADGTNIAEDLLARAREIMIEIEERPDMVEVIRLDSQMCQHVAMSS